MPRWEDIDWTGLPFPKETFDALQEVEPSRWRSEVIEHEELFLDLHASLPPEMIYYRD
jgi:phosphoenolpyruvate carboxykinase (GTP)